MEEEIWKDVIGYEGYYKISNFGRLCSLDRLDGIGRKIKGQICNGTPHKNGYIDVLLSKNTVRLRIGIHRLVAIHFIPNPNNLPFVLHKDDNPKNNHVNNLMWGTPKDNTDDMIKKGRKFTKIVIDTQTGIFYNSVKDAAFTRGIRGSNLSAMLKGRNKNYTSFIYA